MYYWSGFKDTTGSDCDVVISTFQEECENIYLSLCVLHNKEEADVSVILSVCTHTHTYKDWGGEINEAKACYFFKNMVSSCVQSHLPSSDFLMRINIWQKHK